jgi:calcium/calmodulin-dependent protein kinase I
MGVCQSSSSIRVAPVENQSPKKKKMETRSTAEIKGLVDGPRNFDSDAESLCSPQRNMNLYDDDDTKPQLTIVPVSAMSKDLRVDDSEEEAEEKTPTPIRQKSANLLKRWLDEVVGLNPSRDIQTKYDVQEQIGTGSSCTVYRAVDLQTNESLACKRINKVKLVSQFRRELPKALERLKAEITLCMTLNHECIVRVVDVFEDDKNLDVLMEYIDGGELFDHIMERDDMNEIDAAFVVYQLLHALKYLHSCGAIHRDLKPENVMVCNMNSGEGEGRAKSLPRVKLIDFGLSTMLEPGQFKTRSRVGTPGYMAPEILIEHDNHGGKDSETIEYDSAIDMFSLGVLAFVLLTGFMPYSQAEHKDALRRKDMCPKFHPEEWKGVSQSAIEFVRHLLVYEPSGRLTAAQALSHEWIMKWNFDNSGGNNNNPSVGTPLSSPRRLKEGLRRRSGFKNGDNIVAESNTKKKKKIKPPAQYDILMEVGRGNNKSG